MTTVNCIECAGGVPLGDDILVGEIVECPDCGVELEVIALDPVSMDLAPEIEEDWGE
jgi:alpha-aminoadipate carrier protein LysW